MRNGYIRKSAMGGSLFTVVPLCCCYVDIYYLVTIRWWHKPWLFFVPNRNQVFLCLNLTNRFTTLAMWCNANKNRIYETWFWFGCTMTTCFWWLGCLYHCWDLNFFSHMSCCQLASRPIRQQVIPMLTMRLLLTGGCDLSRRVLQTDPSTLLHLISTLEAALAAIKTNHARRIFRNIKWPTPSCRPGPFLCNLFLLWHATLLPLNLDTWRRVCVLTCSWMINSGFVHLTAKRQES